MTYGRDADVNAGLPIESLVQEIQTDGTLDEVLTLMRKFKLIHQETIFQTKVCASAGAQGAEDVVSESATIGEDWDFIFGGIGKITKAIITSVTALTPRMVLYLFTRPPTSNLQDNAPNTAPIAADIPFFIGSIEFPAMIDYGTGASYAIATLSTYGNLSLPFETARIYGVLVTKDIVTFGQTLITVLLSADVEDNE